MAIFNPSPSPRRDPPPQDPPRASEVGELAFAPPATAPSPGAVATAPRPAATPEVKESVIAADLAIEGRIQGAGNVRIAGRFTGDIAVEGDLTIEHGARVNGGVRARRVTVAGDLEGNVESAQRVEVVASGSMVGDVRAGTVTVAQGARMRGSVEFGWGDDTATTATGSKAPSTAIGSDGKP